MHLTMDDNMPSLFEREKGGLLTSWKSVKIVDDLHIHQMQTNYPNTFRTLKTTRLRKLCFFWGWKSIKNYHILQCSLKWFETCRETNPPIRLSNGTQTEFPLFFGGFHTFLQDWLGVVLSKCVLFRPGHITKTYPNLCKLNDFQQTTCLVQ